MPRILPAMLALLLTVGGWVAVPATCVQFLDAADSSAWIDRGRGNQVPVAHAVSQGFDRMRIEQASSPGDRSSDGQALDFAIGSGPLPHILEAGELERSESFPRPAFPLAFSPGQRAPPQQA